MNSINVPPATSGVSVKTRVGRVSVCSILGLRLGTVEFGLFKGNSSLRLSVCNFASDEVTQPEEPTIPDVSGPVFGSSLY